MTQDEIIEMAKQAQMPFYWRTGEITYLDKLERFAKLVAKHERTWVEIDDEDYIKAYELCDFDKDAAFEFFEAKLKAKNT